MTGRLQDDWDTSRYDDLRRLLEAELERQTRGASEAQRLEWLLDRFEMYFRRWRGFSGLRSPHLSEAVKNDLFQLLIFTHEIISKHLKQFGPSAAQDDWEQVLVRVNFVLKSSDGKFTELMGIFETALSSTAELKRGIRNAP